MKSREKSIGEAAPGGSSTGQESNPWPDAKLSLQGLEPPRARSETERRYAGRAPAPQPHPNPASDTFFVRWSEARRPAQAVRPPSGARREPACSGAPERCPATAGPCFAPKQDTLQHLLAVTANRGAESNSPTAPRRVAYRQPLLCRKLP